MINLHVMTSSLYGKKITSYLKTTESELGRQCSCPHGESCRIEITELPNRCFEVMVIRPRPLEAQPTDWEVVAEATAKYQKVFGKRATAKHIHDAIVQIIAAPIEAVNSGEPTAPSIDQREVVFVNLDVLYEARKLITGCGACSPYAEIPFESIMDRVTGHDPMVTRYVLLGSVKCPRCQREVTADTLVEFKPSQ